MNANFRSGFLALAIMLASAVPANAGPFEDGLAAYEREDYATALIFWRPLAEQGHAEAQFNLGVMHYEGWGVPWDIVQAHMWLSLAADHASADDRDIWVGERDTEAKAMTPEQIADMFFDMVFGGLAAEDRR